MVERLVPADARTLARAVTLPALGREIGAEDAERVLELLRNPTTADTARAVLLRVAAEAELEGRRVPPEHRSGKERRSGKDRRCGLERRP
jgi:hypothetical protein